MTRMSFVLPAPLSAEHTLPLSALPVTLLACLPFLSWLRFAPDGDLLANAGALLLAAALILACLPRVGGELALRPGLLAAAALTLAALPALAGSPYPGVALGQLAVLWLAALAAQAVASLPRGAVLAALAWGLFAGGVLQLTIGAAQVFRLAQPWGLLFVVSDGQGTLFGNLAQRNQYANYLTLALLSLCWLTARRRLPAWLFVLLAPLFALFLAWSASRLVIAYALGLSLLAAGLYLAGRRTPALTPGPSPASGRGEGIVGYSPADPSPAGGSSACMVDRSSAGSGPADPSPAGGRRWRAAPDEGAALARMAVALGFAIVLIALCQLFTSQINAGLSLLGLPVDLQSGAGRFTDGGFGARRWIEWQKAWQVFVAHPLTGVGLGGYAAQSVALEPAFAGEWTESWLFAHCHSIVLQLLAETGLTGTLAVAAALMWAFLPWFRRQNIGADALLVLGLALVLLGHSLLEYPLWYASFLMVFAVLVGVSPAAGWALPVRASLRRIGALLLVLVITAQTLLGVAYYFDWVKWVVPSSDGRENKARIEALLTQGANPSWSYDADQLLSNYLGGDAAHLALKQPLFERLAAYRPYPGTLTKLAMLRAHAGDAAGARDALRRAIAAYPATVPNIAATLAQEKAPTLAPLQAMAARAHEAYRRHGALAAARTVR
ncbi:O-antigen ligase family protein [Crenobacter intestini]|uniref:Virulence factor membrane-bound polymerase C-terminal domain-containing protein n=1 Tax=Crenobacter intestini TaxID=2563443 RepID=A0A4T0V4E0_9NEIS|nr:O-antigen ligase family protein [Crenobacter intestini]TIC86241.1 hypothetical protein E5K04_03840 [Crenobacter intestini]